MSTPIITQPTGIPSSNEVNAHVSLANRWRLGIAAGLQLLGVILVGCIPTTNGPGIYYGNTDGTALEVWGIVFTICAAVLVGISVYRFVRPANKVTAALRAQVEQAELRARLVKLEQDSKVS